MDFPIFDPELKSYDGKEITINGYIIPTDGYKSQKEFVFSAYPYKNCFFCGGAGPETVMEVVSPNGINFTSENHTKRKLKLNARLKSTDVLIDKCRTSEVTHPSLSKFIATS